MQIAEAEANREQVFVEHARSLENEKDNLAAARRRKDAELLQAKRDAEEGGVDFERSQNLTYSAEEVASWNKKLRKREKQKDTGFADWSEANLRKHKKLTRDIKPDLDSYEEAKQMLASVDGAIYRDATSIEYANAVDSKPPAEAVDRMVADLNEQTAKRKKHSRFRAADQSEDVSYINDKNMRFNKKVARAYDKHTTDIVQSFERGSAM